MEEKLTVACVLWKGNFQARKYNPAPYTREWVKRLASMVSRNMSVDYEFVCLSNVAFSMEGIRVIPLKHKWEGWWAKMELFRPDLPVSDLILYLDLDMVVLDDLGPFITENGPRICPAFGKQNKLNPRGFNSSVMSFRQSDVVEIWEKWKLEPKLYQKHLRSDQDFLIQFFLDRFEHYPDGLIEKLGHCTNGRGNLEIPEGLKILLSMPMKNVDAIRRYPLIRELWT